jgi:hypothetical protein
MATDVHWIAALTSGPGSSPMALDVCQIIAIGAGADGSVEVCEG